MTSVTFQTAMAIVTIEPVSSDPASRWQWCAVSRQTGGVIGFGLRRTGVLAFAAYQRWERT